MKCTTRTVRLRYLAAATAALLAARAGVIRADDFEWNHSAGGAFTSGAFWTDISAGNSTGVVPDVTGNAIFDLTARLGAAGTYSVTARTNLSTNQLVVVGDHVTLDVSDGAGNAFVYNLQQGSPTSSFSAASLFVANASSLTFTAGTVLAGDVNIGSTDNGGAALTLQTAATFFDVFGGYTLSNFATLNVQNNAVLDMLDNSTLVQSANASINLAGDAVLFLGDGVKISGGALHAGDGVIYATGSTLTYDSLYYDGQLGVGDGLTLNLTSSLADSQAHIIPTTITGSMEIGGGTLNIIGSVVQATPDGGATWQPLNVFGDAQVVIQNAVFTVGNMDLDGDPSPALGSSTSIDPSLVTIHGDLDVGDFGNATLTITGGGSVINVDGVMVVGNRPGSLGTVVVDGIDSFINTGLDLGNSTYGTGELIVGKQGVGVMTISGGATVNVTSADAWIGQNDNGDGTGGSGTLTVDGAGVNGVSSIPSSLNIPAGDLFVGGDAHTQGTLNVTNGGLVVDITGHIAANLTASASVLVDGSFENPTTHALTYSYWHNTGNLLVGESGSGSLTVSNHGLVDNAVGQIAANPGSIGTVLVESAGVWNNASFMDVADDGNASLTIQSGGAVTATDVNMSVYADGVSQATVDHGSWTNSGFLTVGDAGQATLTIQNAGVVSDTEGNIGYASGSVGAVTVSGAGSQWNNSSFLQVGSTGNGTLHIAGGGKVTSTFAGIAFDAASTSLVTIDGSGSAWNVTGEIRVAEAGHATLTLTGAAAMTGTAELFLAAQPNSNAHVTVDASTLTVQTYIDVGYHGVAELDVQNGSTVIAATQSIVAGDQSDATGTIIVDGASSHLTNGDFSNIGAAGTGHLTVRNGGSLTDATSGVIGVFAGSHGDATITDAGSSWSMSFLDVGAAGAGSLLVQNAGKVLCSSTGGMAVMPGGTGTATVTGAGSQWLNAGQLVVAGDGGATLTVSLGGLVTGHAGASPTGSAGIIGEEGTAVGTLTITDPGSAVTLSGHLSVGLGNNGNNTTTGGTGTLDVLNAGLASSVNGYVGRYAGSSGTVLVSGSGAAWQNSGSFFIAANDVANNPSGQTLAAGTGGVTIGSGGTISAVGSALIGPAGTLTLAGGAFSASAITNNGLLQGSGAIGGNLANNATVNVPLASTIDLAGTYTQAPAASLTGGGILIGNAFFGNLATISGTVRVRANGTSAGTSKLNLLTIAGSVNNWSGLLDVTNNKVIVEDSITHATTLSTLQNQANYGKTHSAGIISSVLPVNMAIAIIDNGALAAPLGTFGGLPADAGSILIAPELLGDANFDGLVNFSDFVVLSNHFGASGAGWVGADFNGDGITNFSDFVVLSNHFGATIGGGFTPRLVAGDLPETPAVSGVPEPASLGLLALGSLLLLFGRKATSKQAHLGA